MLAGLHGSFVTGNPRDDVLDMYLERVSLWQKTIELQRADLLSIKHQYILKSHRSKFFANWEVYRTGSSEHYSNRQSRLDSGRFSYPGRVLRCLLPCVNFFYVCLIGATKRAKGSIFSQSFLPSYQPAQSCEDDDVLMLSSGMCYYYKKYLIDLY